MKYIEFIYILKIEFFGIGLRMKFDLVVKL